MPKCSRHVHLAMGVITVFLYPVMVAGQKPVQLPNGFADTVWEGTIWRTDRAGNNRKGTPKHFALAFYRGSLCRISNEFESANIRDTCTWRAVGNSVKIERRFPGNKWIEQYDFTLHGSALVSNSKAADSASWGS